MFGKVREDSAIFVALMTFSFVCNRKKLFFDHSMLTLKIKVVH